MKKHIYLILLSLAIIFFSCRDDSGKFETQLFTNTQISSALSECIRVTSDSTLNALCIVDTLHETQGYYYYDSKAYRIEFPAVAKYVIDTLTAHGFGEALDSLNYNINRAAEQCGNKIKAMFLDPLVKNIVFPNPNLILNGGNNAITNYVIEVKQNDFLTLLKTSILLEQFNTCNISLSWNMLQEEYYKITDKYCSIDIFSSTAQQIVDGFFKKMKLQEEAVRKNPELRGNEKGWLFKVFATLDE